MAHSATRNTIAKHNPLPKYSTPLGGKVVYCIVRGKRTAYGVAVDLTSASVPQCQRQARRARARVRALLDAHQLRRQVAPLLLVQQLSSSRSLKRSAAAH